jgi:hypothetical protein
MIKVYSGHLLIREGSGRRTFSSEELRRQLWECCQAVGFPQDWLADHISLLIEDYLLDQRLPGGELPSRAEVDRLVARVLVDAGYADVAAEYCRRQRLGPNAWSASHSPWSAERVQRLLATTVPVTAEELSRLVLLTIQALGSLGFARVTDELVRELGVHLLAQGSDSSAAVTATKPASPWLLTSKQCESLLTPAAADLLRDSVVRLCPVSRLLPVLRLRVDLSRLGTRTASPPLTELAFLPALYHACQAVRDSLTALRNGIRDCEPITCLTPAQVTVAGLWHLVHDQFQCPAGARAAGLAREISGIVLTELSGPPAAQVKVKVLA